MVLLPYATVSKHQGRLLTIAARVGDIVGVEASLGRPQESRLFCGVGPPTWKWRFRILKLGHEADSKRVGVCRGPTLQKQRYRF